MKRAILALGLLFLISVSGWAGSTTSKGFLYKPDLGARGTAEKDLFNVGLDRVDARLGKEIWLGDPSGSPGYDSLAHALATIGSNQTILRLPAGTITIADNTVIPANVTLKPERGAILTIATTKTMTINGGLDAGLYQIFSCTGSGKVIFGPNAVDKIYVAWWYSGTGNIAPSIRAAVTSKISGEYNGADNAQGANVWLMDGTWSLTTSLNLTNLRFFNLHGLGDATILNSTATGKAAIDLVGSFDYHIGSFTVNGDASSTPTVAILRGRSTASVATRGAFLENVYYIGNYIYGCVYDVSIEVSFDSGTKTLIGASGFYRMFSPKNSLALASDYVTIETTISQTTQMANYIKDFHLSAIPGGVNFIPFIFEGTTLWGVSPYAYSWTSSVHIHDGYIYAPHTVASGAPHTQNMGQVIWCKDGAQDIHIDNVDVEGLPDTIFWLTGTLSDTNFYNLTAKNIKSMGTPYPMRADANCDLWNCKFENLFIGGGASPAGFEVLGSMRYSTLGTGWFGFDSATGGLVNIAGTSRGNEFILGNQVITLGADYNNIIKRAFGPSLALCPDTASSCTLTANSTTTVVSTANVSANSLIFLMPVTATAAADQGSATGVWISAKNPGVSFTITHPSSANANKTFNYWIVN